MEIYHYSRLKDDALAGYSEPGEKEALSFSDRIYLSLLWLIEGLEKHISKIPKHIPLYVLLSIDKDCPEELVINFWNEICATKAFPENIQVSVTSNMPEIILPSKSNKGDIEDVGRQEAIYLYAAIKLHSVPPPNSAEAAAALLLGDYDLAKPLDLKPLGYIASQSYLDIDNAEKQLEKITCQNETQASQYEHIWQFGVDQEAGVALCSAALKTGLNISSTEPLGGLFNVDNAIGHAGVTALSLGLAMGAEFAATSQKPQLLAVGNGSITKLYSIHPYSETFFTA